MKLKADILCLGWVMGLGWSNLGESGKFSSEYYKIKLK